MANLDLSSANIVYRSEQIVSMVAGVDLAKGTLVYRDGNIALPTSCDFQGMDRPFGIVVTTSKKGSSVGIVPFFNAKNEPTRIRINSAIFTKAMVYCLGTAGAIKPVTDLGVGERITLCGSWTNETANANYGFLYSAPTDIQKA